MLLNATYGHADCIETDDIHWIFIDEHTVVVTKDGCGRALLMVPRCTIKKKSGIIFGDDAVLCSSDDIMIDGRQCEVSQVIRF